MFRGHLAQSALLVSMFAVAMPARDGLAQVPYDSELLTNSNFEAATLLAWTPTSGTTVFHNYGTTPWNANLGNALNGGVKLLRDNGAAKVQQNINVDGNQIDIGSGLVFARISADLGGNSGDDDAAQVNIKFIDALGLLISTVALPAVKNGERNGEAVLLRRTALFAVPPATRQIGVEIAFSGTSSGGWWGAIDNVHLQITKNPASSPQPLNQELLINGGFESGYIETSILRPEIPYAWRGTNSSTVIPIKYGESPAPSTAVQAALNGGVWCLNDWSGGDAKIRQVLDVTGNAAAIDANSLWLRVAGDFGGFSSDGDRGRLVTTFFGSSSQVLGSLTIGDVNAAHRLNETLLLRRSAFRQIPPGTRSIQLDLEFVYDNGGAGASDAVGMVDNLSALLTMNPAYPTHGLGQNLITNSDFESGYSLPSIFNPQVESGWFCTTSSTVAVVQYGSSEAPGVTTQQAMAEPSGNYLVRDWSGGDARIRQEIDLRGDIALVDAGDTWLAIEAYLGGFSSDSDRAWVDARFYDSVGAEIGLIHLEEVNREHRFLQTTLVRRNALGMIPVGARRLVVEVAFDYITTPSANACIDNLKVWMTKSTPTPLALNQNLITNSGFEGSSLLDINSSNPWRGVTADVPAVKLYGADATTPTTAVAASVQGGANLLADPNTDAALKQVFDLTGNASLVDQGRLALHLEGLLGGYSTDPDNAKLVVRFFQPQSTVATLVGTLGPVTAADRANQTTLIKRQGDFPVPPFSRTVEVELSFDYVSGSTSDAVADNITAVLFDVVAGSPISYPGTGEDLRMFSGTADPLTTGTGFDIKTVNSGQVLRMRFSSPTGIFNYSPLVVLASVFQTGSYPGGLLPGIAITPSYAFLIDGISPALTGAQFNPFLLFPGGNEYAIAIPPGLTGYSALIQGFVVPIYAPVGFSPQLPLNGLFASTDAHEFKIQ